MVWVVSRIPQATQVFQANIAWNYQSKKHSGIFCIAKSFTFQTVQEKAQSIKSVDVDVIQTLWFCNSLNLLWNNR